MSRQLNVTSRLKVFVSSKNSLRDERDAARHAIEELHMEPVLVEMDRWIASTDQEEWLVQLEGCDLMVLVLHERLDAEDSAREEEFYRFVEQETELAASAGKPVLFFVRSAESGQESHLVERMYTRTFPRRFSEVEDLGPAIQEAILSEVFKRYRVRSVKVPDRKDFYERAAELVRRARRRVYLGADTPVVFFGPRKRQGFENDFFEEMMRYVESLRSPEGSERECVVFFNEESVRRELPLIRDQYDSELILENLRALDEVWKAGGKLRLLPTPGPHTYAIFDDSYVVWIRSGPRWFGVRDRSPDVCDGLSDLVHRMAEDALYRARDSGASQPETNPTHWLRIFEEAIREGSGDG